MCARERKREREGERENMCDLLSREVLYALGWIRHSKYPLLAVVLSRISVFVIRRATEYFILERQVTG